MKIAISTGKENKGALLNPRFGRCEFFAIYDTELKEWKFYPNPGALEGSGAGIKAAEFIIEQEVDVLLTGELGPKAASLIEGSGVKFYRLPEITLQEAVAEFEKGNIAAPQTDPVESPGASGDQLPEEVFLSRGRIAIATEGTGVAQHFGRCQAYTIVDIEDGREVNSIVSTSPGHQPGFLPGYLREKGVNCVIAGGMGPRAQGLFAEQGIYTIIGVTGSVKDAVRDYLRGNLTAGVDLCSQGQPGHGHGCGDHGHGHQHGDGPGFRSK
ncbi:MAG TPA: hypothetical protein GXZ24_09095 [Firmicutes bacterium]|jgi:predicted Fe-Mo cluster-binding NifX family protein|nr:hypothetical protein [Bacillota bacterium]